MSGRCSLKYWKRVKQVSVLIPTTHTEIHIKMKVKINGVTYAQYKKANAAHWADVDKLTTQKEERTLQAVNLTLRNVDDLWAGKTEPGGEVNKALKEGLRKRFTGDRAKARFALEVSGAFNVSVPMIGKYLAVARGKEGGAPFTVADLRKFQKDLKALKPEERRADYAVCNLATWYKNGANVDAVRKDVKPSTEATAAEGEGTDTPTKANGTRFTCSVNGEGTLKESNEGEITWTGKAETPLAVALESISVFQKALTGDELAQFNAEMHARCGVQVSEPVNA